MTADSRWLRRVAGRSTARFSRTARRQVVVSQYETSEVAASYARGYGGSTPEGRFFRSRLRLVERLLSDCPGGDLLDAGCGPGAMVRRLLERRAREFRITVLDQSPAMVTHCAAFVRDVGEVLPAVGDIEAMPFADEGFDVVLVMGALEYVSLARALDEVGRVTRQGGLVVVSMLNPLSLYRAVEWLVYWPVVRIVGSVGLRMGIPGTRRHRAQRSGIRAVPAFWLVRMMRRAGIEPVDVRYFDVTLALPPLDRLPRLARSTGPFREEVGRRDLRKFLATGYVVAARRSGSAGW